ncbi:ABC transporter permease [Leifsonia sp. Leaf336]|uniref:carbohydrate ABC transporter permease n=1 Tax=Leifsonia sp. Leaf336 TaxID=1736341 RepID=UPI0006F23953|nr:carbohydrate ABC transporter permease [Leifsonia sp. Leaf336]KQR53628.1 ABC transporter permease [Leifsonia sp. Leaf336]
MKKSRGVILSVVMLPIACVAAIPFYYILVNTLKTQEQTAANPLALPTSFYLGNYVHVFQTLPIFQSFLNTLYVTVISIALMLLIGSMAAFGVLIGRGRLATIIGVVLVIAFLVPGQATLIPLYHMLAGVQLVDSLNGLIVMYACGSIFCYFLIIGYMRSLPGELFEAARIDGAGPFRIYWSVALPLIRPILVTVGVFQTMWVWNDFITPNVFINSPDKQTLVLQVYSAVGQFTTDWPAFMTLSVIVLVPMVIFFLVAQRQIVSGLVSGSVKG